MQFKKKKKMGKIMFEQHKQIIVSKQKYYIILLSDANAKEL